MRATVPAVQVRVECSYGTCRSSQQARLGPLPSLSSSSAVVLRKGGEISRKPRLSTLHKKDPGIAPGPSLQPRGLKYWLCELFLATGGTNKGPAYYGEGSPVFYSITLTKASGRCVEFT